MANIPIHGEGIRKPVYLAVLGISIVVAAVSLGVTLTRYLGLRSYSPKGTATAAATPAGPAIPDTPPEQWNNLFAPGDGMKLASRLPAVDGKSASRPTRTNFVLVGTIVSSSPAARRAILWTNGMKEPKAFREKDEVEPGAILTSVERDKAWIARGNEREKLEILPVGSRARPTGAAASAAAPPVSASAPRPAVPPGATALPGAATATRPSPGATQSMAPPGNAPRDEEEEHLTPRQRRRRALGLPR